MLKNNKNKPNKNNNNNKNAIKILLTCHTCLLLFKPLNFFICFTKTKCVITCNATIL